MPVSVELKGVSKSFGKKSALDKVTITFAGGKLHGLIGSEGAGKTTLIRVIMELLSRDEGDISWNEDGRKIKFPDLREKISYMPGAQSLYPDLSVKEHLEFFRELYSLPKEEFESQRERLLEITRLDKFTARRSRELSGGMYKKLGLMCALLQKPKVLLLDEPTNGIDPISRREFWDMLYDLSKQQITIIISTAYMDEAERCHEAHLLDAGKHLVSGEPRKLLADSGVKSFDEFYLKRGTK
jgi:ABC-2 type transport system ATP-binding protein